MGQQLDNLCSGLVIYAARIVGFLLRKKMAAMASSMRYAVVRNACVLRFMLVRSAAAGFQRDYFQTRTCYQFSALHRSPFMQVLYCRIDVVVSKAVIQYFRFDTTHFLHANL